MSVSKIVAAAASSAGGAGLDVDEVFSTFLYTGTAQARSIVNGIDLSGEGGLIWNKKRNGATNHSLFDSERSNANAVLKSNATNAQYADNAHGVQFNNNGWGLTGTDQTMNANGDDYVSWTFRKAPKFFDVVTYSGQNTDLALSHNLGVAPGMVIVKRTDTSGDWYVYHRSLNLSENLSLNSTGDVGGNNFWTSSAPSSTVFNIDGNRAAINQSGGSYVAYLFAHNDNSDGEFGPDSDQDIIKCGSYTGNSTDARTIDLGFEAQWLLVKRSDGATDWWIVDSMRGLHARQISGKYLEANTSNAEASQGKFFADSQGFMVDAGDYNTTGETYIYMAIRRGPLAAPEDATKVFGMDDYDGSPSAGPTTGFVTDMSILGQRAGGNDKFYLGSRLTGTKALNTTSTAAEANQANQIFDRMDGAWNGNVSTYMLWGWKRAPSYFDVCCYTGTGSARTVPHGLQKVPEMMWVKRRDTTNNWKTFHSSLGGTKSMELNTTVAPETNGSALWNSTAPTASVFSLGTASDVNGSGSTYIAYLFATVAGVSKVGSYTGSNSSAVTVDCGFSNGARFVLIKSVDGAGNWKIWDSVRGINSSANEPYLKLNNTDAEVTNSNNIDPHSSGFTVTQQSNSPISQNGETFIFYAIA
jgi:hypothetical protein